MITGEHLKNKGMQQAVDNADNQHPTWSAKAYQFLLNYAKNHREFMAEDVREAALLIVPEPPSYRAWGSVFLKAARNNIIKRAGYRSVKNIKAHRTPATVWEVVK